MSERMHKTSRNKKFENIRVIFFFNEQEIVVKIKVKDFKNLVRKYKQQKKIKLTQNLVEPVIHCRINKLMFWEFNL